MRDGHPFPALLSRGRPDRAPWPVTGRPEAPGPRRTGRRRARPLDPEVSPLGVFPRKGCGGMGLRVFYF